MMTENHETPILGFPSRRQNGSHFVGLPFPAGGEGESLAMTSRALFAAGCFWGVQYYFDQVPGVSKSIAGYTGGHTQNPTYEEVCDHTTGHAEAVLLEFDAEQVSYETLVKHFFRMHDPTQLNRQGPDVGDQYRSAIFYFDQEQKLVAEQVRDAEQAKYEQPIVTEVSQAQEFYPAEDYHQKYTEKTGRGMCHVAYEPIPEAKK